MFESEVAGLLCADMCTAAGKVLAVQCVLYNVFQCITCGDLCTSILFATICVLDMLC